MNQLLLAVYRILGIKYRREPIRKTGYRVDGRWFRNLARAQSYAEKHGALVERIIP